MSALRQPRTPAPSAAARYYSLRRLSPYQGTVQVVELPGFRAMSADGVTWTVQMPNEGSRFATHALWRPDGSGTLVEDARTEIPLAALRARPAFPFPLADTLELWLLDAKESLPLATLASTLPRRDAPMPRAHESSEGGGRATPGAVAEDAQERPPRATPPSVQHPIWQAALKGDNSFVAASYAELGMAPSEESHRERLERRVAETAGEPPRAQWFQRAADGGGHGLNGLNLPAALEGRPLAAAQFPVLLLRERWDNRGDAALVRDYHDWLAPRLLTHADLARPVRDRLERAACRQAEAFYRLRHLMPEAVNPELVQVAMVEAVIRRAGRADA